MGKIKKSSFARKDFVRLLDWMRANVERINKTPLELGEIATLAKSELGIEVTRNHIRRTRKEFDIPIVLKRDLVTDQNSSRVGVKELRARVELLETRLKHLYDKLAEDMPSQ